VACAALAGSSSSLCTLGTSLGGSPLAIGSALAAFRLFDRRGLRARRPVGPLGDGTTGAGRTDGITGAGGCSPTSSFNNDGVAGSEAIEMRGDSETTGDGGVRLAAASGATGTRGGTVWYSSGNSDTSGMGAGNESPGCCNTEILGLTICMRSGVIDVGAGGDCRALGVKE
jgi:hypothetical protein